MAEKIKVLVADDHAVVRSGLAAILGEQSDIIIIGEAKDGLEAISKALELKPDVILMDIFMPNCTGLDAMISIRERAFTIVRNKIINSLIELTGFDELGGVADGLICLPGEQCMDLW